MLRQYFNCNEIKKIFLTSFCNILCHVGIFVIFFAITGIRNDLSTLPNPDIW